MSTPENTSHRHPIVHVAGSWDDPSSYITEMEAAGQRQVVASDVLPAKAPWDDLGVLGFVPGEMVEGDPSLLFVHCTLPAGWTREGSEHAMWSYLLDERGVRRVAIFYKAAFYDRDAHAHLERPGKTMGSAIIYGSQPVTLPEKWDVLTAEEKQDLRDEAREYLRSAERAPHIYDSAERAQALLDLAGPGLDAARPVQ